MLGKENMQQLLINMNVINNKLYAIVVKASKILEGYIKDKDRLLFFFFSVSLSWFINAMLLKSFLPSNNQQKAVEG